MTRIEASDGARPSGLVVGAVAGAAGIAGLANRVAVSTGVVDDGAWGAFLARLDVAPVVLLVVAGYWLYRPYVATGGRRRLWPSRASLARSLGAVYVVWWAVVAIDAVALRPRAGLGRWLATIVMFRDPRPGWPILGLGVGTLVLSAVLFALLVLLVAAAVGGRRRPEIGWIAALALVAVSYRLIVAAGGHTAPYGPLSWLPNHLDALGAGMAVAVLADARRRGARRWTAGHTAAVLGAGSVLFLVGAALLDRRPLPDAVGGVLGHSLVALGVATAVGVAVLSGDAPLPVRVAARRAVVALAVAAPGFVLCAELVFVMVARRYRVEVVETPGGVLLQGPGAGPFLWSLAVTAAIGVLLSLLLTVLSAATGRRPTLPAFGLALASTVALGFLIRVIALLAIAPERTDAGDARFYHTTANLLANGRGFAEPLHWIAFQQFEPSALHGPLYSVVLSFSSRLGATDWFDHKMLSVLIGTATVLVTALVARRFGGAVAAILAALFAAFYPNLWLLDGLLFPEGLFALLVMLVILVAYQWRDRPRLVAVGALGVLIGLSALTRGEGLLLIPLLAVPWILRTPALAMRARLTHLGVAVAACLVVLTPWTVRNAVTFANFVPISTNGDELLVYANCDDTYSGRLLGYWSFACQERIRQEIGDPPGDASQQATYWRRVGIDYARAHLDRVPLVLAARLGRQWELYRPGQNVELGTIEGRDRTSGRIGLAMYYLLVGASIIALVRLRRRRKLALAAGSDGSGAGASTWPLVSQFVCVSLTALYAYGNIRFRAPVEAVLCALAAVAVAPLAVHVVGRLRSRWPTVRRTAHVATVAHSLGGPFEAAGAERP